VIGIIDRTTKFSESCASVLTTLAIYLFTNTLSTPEVLTKF